ncbi:TIGR04219 family outer membrane beta-barrel protein [Colwellia sp. BRX10-3]|uniref:TIGR04219 family outer membrane beta-barrel protein n=1 Tax=Colwellia sp. BRX10-3 TaxID=2759844 RepID=UPI0015F6C09D|nr:TIGR04219 family outer membrane beta-barrel protein [Colwellia sp. BRX10-3]MBA6392045.1 TIGR04219 family outer membrane beta-barrel protein [Colwellia sp. BRX10-3]
MKKLALVVTLASILSTNVQADALGIYLGGQIWDNQASGTFGDGSSQIDFNLADKKQNSFFIAFEHPLALIPNVRISSTSLETEGNTTLKTDFEFDGKTFNEDTNVNADFNVSYLDYTLYYELFDNDLVSFDIGLTGRDFDGDVTVSASSDSVSQSGTVSVTDIVPMLYVRTNVGLPLTGLNLYAQGNFLSIDDHTLYDYEVGVSYELIDNLAVDVNINAGYRAVKLELDDLNDLYTNIEFDGVFLGTTIHF